MPYIAKYHSYINTCLKKYPHLKTPFEKKKDYIIQNPLQLGEPLKGTLNGLRSFPLQKNFIIIYLICDECRKLNQEFLNKCTQCGQIPQNSVIFLLFGPHDYAYKSAPGQRVTLQEE